MQRVAAVNESSVSGGFLINEGSAKNQFTTFCRQDQIAVLIDRRISPIDAECDRTGISMWLNNEIVLGLALIAVVREVNASVDPFVSHAPICWNVRTPFRAIVPDEIVCRENYHYG
jgi:hypothetical protein